MIDDDHMNEDAPSIEFRYIRPASYQSYHVDGFVGGWGPTGNLNLDLYLERTALPEMVVHELEGKKLGKELGRQGGQGLVRERQCGIVLSPAGVVALRDWLTARIESGHELGLLVKIEDQ